MDKVIIGICPPGMNEDLSEMNERTLRSMSMEELILHVNLIWVVIENETKCRERFLRVFIGFHLE